MAFRSFKTLFAFPRQSYPTCLLSWNGAWTCHLSSWRTRTEPRSCATTSKYRLSPTFHSTPTYPVNDSYVLVLSLQLIIHICNTFKPGDSIESEHIHLSARFVRWTALKCLVCLKVPMFNLLVWFLARSSHTCWPSSTISRWAQLVRPRSSARWMKPAIWIWTLMNYRPSFLSNRTSK